MDRPDFACMGATFVRRRACYAPAWFAAAALSVAAAPAWSQGSRTEAVEERQAAKAKDLEPRQPPRGERLFKRIQDELIDEPSGLYPLFGSVYAGGGFALGAGYRGYYGDNTHWDAKALYSIRNYRLVELSTDSWNHAGGRIDLHARAGWRDAPSVAFHGLGIDSGKDAVGFALTQTYAGGEIALRPLADAHLKGGIAYEDYSIGASSGPRPTIETRFTAATAPALGLDPSYWHATASAGYDWRPSPGYARTGGLYELRYHRYVGGPDDFERVEGEVVQHVPLLRENYVLSLRGQVETILDDDATVPFYLLSTLGGSDTLRGYSSWRFRDRHAALTSAEFRWIPNRSALDVAVFYDAGMVAPRFDDLSMRRFTSDVGIGVRFHGPLSTPLRIEVASGREGVRLVLSGRAAF
jgi:outer membrane protein assembly factor BamA